MDSRQLLLESFRAAVAAADPLKIVPAALPDPPSGRTIVVGAGKAAAAMAVALESHWPADAPLEGLVITRYGHALPTRRIRVVEAGHPVPDQSGAAAAGELAEFVRRAGARDLVIGLVSGGGSALLSAPADGIAIDELRATTRELLRCGAPIQEINTVRKHLGALLGGQLAAACRAKVIALIISDVTGDEATQVASGPFAPDPSTYADALAVLERHRVEAPAAVLTRLRNGRDGRIAETPKPDDPLFGRVENRVIASARISLKAGAAWFERHEVPAVIFADSVTGEAREVAKVHGALVRQVIAHGEPFAPPVALLSGGECTVTIRGQGRGGRCSEFLLSLAIDLDGAQGVHAIACDTDGIDGTEANAGAIISPDTLERARGFGLDPHALLADNDAWRFFDSLSDLVMSGPTRTNVNDYRAILVQAGRRLRD